MVNLEIILHNKRVNIETEIGDDETIADFMKKHGIYDGVPDKFKAMIYDKKKIDNSALMKDYVQRDSEEVQRLHFWFKLRWHLEMD